MTIAIHQPTFFPWLGYFNKIQRSDRFVILDDTQFIKKGSDWTNRVYLLSNGAPTFVTVAVDRNYHGFKMVNEIEIDQKNVKWIKTMRGLISGTYKKHPFYAEVFDWVESHISDIPVGLGQFNEQVIRDLVDRLDLDTSKLVKSSELEHSGTSTDRLVSLVRTLEGDTYLCGDGAGGYQDDSLFEVAGIGVEYQQFKHPEYEQRGTDSFVAGLSIIDCLMNLGFDETSKLIKNY